jgi:hypothetical protein
MSSRETSPMRCDLPRAAFAGFTAGYVMALAGYWIEAVLGIGEINFAYAGLRYVAGNRAGWWIVGIVFHLIDSTLLGLLYAGIVQPALAPWTARLGRLRGGVVGGVAFAASVWLILAMLVAMPFMGAGVFGRRTGSVRPALAALILHLLYGIFLGFVYARPERCAPNPAPAAGGPQPSLNLDAR